MILQSTSPNTRGDGVGAVHCTQAAWGQLHGSPGTYCNQREAASSPQTQLLVSQGRSP